MSFHFLDLDERTRTLMALEFEDDLTNQRVYMSDRLNPQGHHQYPDVQHSQPIRRSGWPHNCMQSRSSSTQNRDARQAAG